MSSFAPPAQVPPTPQQIADALTDAAVTAHLDATAVRSKIDAATVTANLTAAAVTANLTSAAVDAALTQAGVTAKLDAVAVRGKIDAATITSNLTDAAVTAHLTPAAVDAAVTIAGITAKLDATAVRGKIDAVTVTANLTSAAVDAALTAAGVTAKLTDAAVAAHMPKIGFYAHKNGTNQSFASNTPALVTFGTEVYDTGNAFASSRWTPPAGYVVLSAACFLAPATTANVILTLRKNNVAMQVDQQLFASGELVVATMDKASGTDYYEVWLEVVATTGDINGGVQYTHFAGQIIAPP